MGTKITIRNGAKYTLTAHSQEEYADMLEKIRTARKNAPSVSTAPSYSERRFFVEFTNTYGQPEMLFIDNIIGIEAVN